MDKDSVFSDGPTLIGAELDPQYQQWLKVMNVAVLARQAWPFEEIEL